MVILFLDISVWMIVVQACDLRVRCLDSGKRRWYVGICINAVNVAVVNIVPNAE